MTGDDDLHALADSVDAVVRSLRGPGARVTAGVFGEWDALVGDTLAAHVRPVVLDDGRLLLEVDEPGWATQLRFLEADLLGRLAAAVGPGMVRAIDVRVRRA
jgi:predicted nucleic acid-binding Zn ribbon protein